MKPILLVLLVALVNFNLLISQDPHPGTPAGKGMQGNDYPIVPVPYTSIVLADSFWLPRINTVHDVTIPHSLQQSADKIMNFRIAAGIESGPFQSYFPFDDTDIYKTIEAVSYSLYYNYDEDLIGTVDSIITIIGMAQETDGYLYTSRTIGSFLPGFPVDWLGDLGTRWMTVHLISHELYNLGHLFEAACAWYEATGNDNLLTIAIKAADLVDETFGWGKLESYPGHQIVEIGLVRLYRLTGDTRYLDLARFFLDVRGPGGDEYSQSHLPVLEQTEAVGHSVRAVYMYAGMADVAVQTDNPSYLTPLNHIWEDISTGKTYVTGGIGSAAYNEGFTTDFDLPNLTSYCENCSSIGNIFFNHRLFLLYGDSKYIDMMERILYNGLLSGISLSGDRFFYSNRLEANSSVNRSTWFTCACCPPNLAKTLPVVPGLIYATTGDSIYVNLFITDTALIQVENRQLTLIQDTRYPWDGKVDISVNNGGGEEFALLIRIPGWTRNEVLPGGIYSFADDSEAKPVIEVNGEPLDYETQKGYAVIRRNWADGDRITLDMTMEPRRVEADDRIIFDRFRFAVQRGPIVYCAEAVDNDDNIRTRRYSPDAAMISAYEPSVMGGIEIVKLASTQLDGTPGDDVTLIPYGLWNNRGPASMLVWLMDYLPASYPDSLILILDDDNAVTNHVSEWEDINGIFDLYNPVSSSDKGYSAFGNWMYDGGTVGTWNWVQYNFSEEKTIGSSEVYWWRDGAGINLPDSSFISWYDESGDSFIKIESTLKWDENILPDAYNKEVFTPVKTAKIRLNFFGKTMAQGILEWKVYSTNSSSPVGLIPGDGAGIRIYPNPVPDRFTVDLDWPGDAIITVINSSGQPVYSNRFSNRITIDRSDIGGRGIYHITVTVNNRLFKGKIIIP
ncbi:MAG: T9SS type A sorting domain-containing protein [Bacteroidia bacterium]|nr:MAG: T9SS type A sorting domain-containing protein [Bacteroidia bacterium]